MSVQKTRNVRVEDELWGAAQQAAREQGETVAVVIRRALIAYVAERRRAAVPAVSPAPHAGTPED